MKLFFGLMLVVCCGLSACGQTGPLYLPQTDQTTSPSEQQTTESEQEQPAPPTINDPDTEF